MTTAINAELDAVVGGFSDTLKKMLTPAPKTVGTGLPGLVGGKVRMTPLGGIFN
jgi:hypothetical protein